MRQTLNYAVDKGIIEKNPLSLVEIDGTRLFRKIKKMPSETQVFIHKEVEQIASSVMDDFHNRTNIYELSPLTILFQFETGLRPGELCAI